ncbi:MAG: hypothetical protein ACRD6X_21815, partial [Pyrinomonadaceae bacterium]
LNEQLSEIRKEQKTEKNKVKALEKILTTDPEKTTTEPMYSTEQIAEMETLSLRLKMKENYEKSWREQRSLVDSAGSDSPASRKLLKVDPAADFTRHKDNLVAGRALAREIVARVELDKAKEDLKTFTESKRFQKFAVTDKTTGSVAFLSLHDVDLPSRGSLLDRALRELIEGREHRELRRTVTNLVKGRQQRLKDEVSAAKDIMAFAFRDSVEFKEFSLLGFKSEPMYSPVFTSSEIIAIEMRVSNTKDPKEAARLQPVLETAVDQPSRSLGKILSDFENPQLPTYTPEKERDPSLQRSVDRTEVVAREDQAKTPIRSEKLKEPKSPGHNR